MDNKYLSVYEKQKKYFLTKETYNYAFRKQMLLTLQQMLIKNEKAIKVSRKKFNKSYDSMGRQALYIEITNIYDNNNLSYEEHS